MGIGEADLFPSTRPTNPIQLRHHLRWNPQLHRRQILSQMSHRRSPRNQQNIRGPIQQPRRATCIGAAPDLPATPFNSTGILYPVQMLPAPRSRRLLRNALILCAGTLSAAITPAQPGAPPKLQFDVVSIKRNLSGEQRGIMSLSPDGNSLVVSNAPMYRIVGFAFDFQHSDLVLDAPEWTYSERWDIEAKVDPSDLAAFHALTLRQKQTMLESVLIDRCKLQAHVVEKEVPVYALKIASGGLKMHELQPAELKGKEDHGWDIEQKHGEIVGRAVPMGALLYALSDVNLGRQVIDRTALKGLYNFDLTWAPDDETDGDNGLNNTHRLSIFTAIQDQLGLRLEATRAPVRALSIEHIEHPTDN